MYVHSILHYWACKLISEGHFIKYVCCWEFACELFEIFFFFVFTLSYFFKSEMSDLFLETLCHCHFHHYIHYWCDFHSMFDLSWSPIFFVYSLFFYHPCHCLWFIPFTPLPFSFLTLTYSRFDIFPASFLPISLSVWFASSPHYWYYIHIGHPQVHDSRDFLYMLHFIHEGMRFLSLGIWA